MLIINNNVLIFCKFQSNKSIKYNKTALFHIFIQECESFTDPYCTKMYKKTLYSFILKWNGLKNVSLINARVLRTLIMWKEKGKNAMIYVYMCKMKRREECLIVRRNQEQKIIK